MSKNTVTVSAEKWNTRVEKIDTEEIQELYDWLQGKTAIDRISFEAQPKLTEQEAFSVIYYLQERLGVIEDNYEVCCDCGNIFDSYEEGEHIDGCGFYCDNCRPDLEFMEEKINE